MIYDTVVDFPVSGTLDPMGPILWFIAFADDWLLTREPEDNDQLWWNMSMIDVWPMSCMYTLVVLLFLIFGMLLVLPYAAKHTINRGRESFNRLFRSKISVVKINENFSLESFEWPLAEKLIENIEMSGDRVERVTAASELRSVFFNMWMNIKHRQEQIVADPYSSNNLDVLMTGNSGMSDVSKEIDIFSRLSGVKGQKIYNRDIHSDIQKAAIWEVPVGEVPLLKKIAAGASGEVFQGLFRGTTVAVKRFFPRLLTTDLIKEFRHEVNMCHALRHPNIVLFMGATARLPNLWMVLEWMQRGSLADVIDRHSRVRTFVANNPSHKPDISTDIVQDSIDNLIEWSRASALAIDCARALHFLHSCRPPIAHRDIKSANFLVDHAWTAKLADFGVSRSLQKTEKAGTLCGTPINMAPEILRGELYSLSADIYSFAIVLLDLANRDEPSSVPRYHLGDIVGIIVHKGERPPISTSCPPSFRKIITDCWRTSPSSRPSFRTVLTMLENFERNMDYVSLDFVKEELIDEVERIAKRRNTISKILSSWEKEFIFMNILVRVISLPSSLLNSYRYPEDTIDVVNT